MPNHLHYGDNLDVIRAGLPYLHSESVDLIYLDPPFNSQTNYNVLFKAPGGENSNAQIEAFVDTWHWNAVAEEAFDQVRASGNIRVFEMLDAIRRALGENDMMAYLTMMAIRLIELHRVLKSTGSLYLHCDPTASHYLKILLDAVFGPDKFRNEIVWKRSVTKGDAKRKFSDDHDIIFFYSKSDTYQFYPIHHEGNEIYQKRFNRDDHDGRGPYHLAPLDSPNIRPNLMFNYAGFSHPPKGWRVSLLEMERLDQEGRIWFPQSKNGRLRRKLYLSEQLGPKIGNVWVDIRPLQAGEAERLGYPTQKPVSLLERILSASSKPGDVVLDPFCGCGTSIHAAEKLGRQWIGIDITHLAISLIEKRLKDAFPGLTFEVHGTPKDLAGARDLAKRDPYQFQWWAVSLVDAIPFGGRKKGADGGIDGLIYFKSDAKTTEKVIVSVKAGANVSVSMIRDLAHVVERERAKIGLFITLAEPTQPMVTEAAKTGFYQMPGWDKKFPKLQILTIDALFSGQKPQIPLVDPSAFRRAAREAAAPLPDLF